MALISCPECTTEISDKASACPKCGCPIGPLTPPAAPAATVVLSKSRGTFIILGVMFGTAGIHNFYAGRNIAGAAKLALLLLCLFFDAVSNFRTGWLTFALVITGLWALCELIFTKTDGQGNPLT